MGMSEVGSSSAKSEPNIVPFTDILLVLLVIFMVVTPSLMKGVNVKLPEAANTANQPKSGELITVHLKEDGTIYIDDKQVEDISKLTTMLEDRLEEKKKTSNKILLRADINVEYGKVVDVMNEIKNAQIEDVGLLVVKGSSGL